MIDKMTKEIEEKMSKSLDAFNKEILKIRTGRASVSMLDSVKVDYYGNLTVLNQMASVSVPESRLIVIQPWDVSMIKEIEKGILKANLGLTPSSDGKVVRISVPALTEDRRKDIVKQVKKFGEDYKVALRNIRRDINENAKTLKKNSELTEDELFKFQNSTQDITNKFIKKIDDICIAKEKEILEF